MKNALPGLVIGLVGAAFLAACSALGGLQHASTALVLAFPAAYVYVVTRNDRHQGNETASTCDWLMVAYAVLYVAVVFRINILGASVALWLVQCLVPWAILRSFSVPVASTGFELRRIVERPSIVAACCLILTPFLLYGIRDAEKVRALACTWKFCAYLPLSILYMTLIVALWEEFFFRGVLMTALRRVSSSGAVSVGASALLFAAYHVPMRYFNVRSPTHGELAQSVASTLGEHLPMGLLLGFIVLRTRNVWHGIWIHAFLNGLSFVHRLTTMVKF